MQYLLLPLRFLYKIYYLIVFSLSVILAYPIMYFLLADPKRFPWAFKMIRLHGFLRLVFAGAHLRVKGAENIPEKGAYIICPNHTSFLDIFCIYTIFKQYFVFTGKKEIEKWPLFHIYYTSGMNILVDRDNAIGSFKAIKRMSQELDKGNPLAIFPEGTISKQVPQMAPFKSGAFAIAIQKQVPIIPITFVSNWKILQGGSPWKGSAGPGIADVIIHKPVFTTGLGKENIEELQNRVREIINGPLVDAQKK